MKLTGIAGSAERRSLHVLARMVLASHASYQEQRRLQGNGDLERAAIYGYQALERARLAACLHQGLDAGLEHGL